MKEIKKFRYTVEVEIDGKWIQCFQKTAAYPIDLDNIVAGYEEWRSRH